MAWECAECHTREGVGGNFVDAVCHHCGKPLCHQDRVRIMEDVFGDQADAVMRIAVHCRECKQRHHTRTATIDWLEEE